MDNSKNIIIPITKEARKILDGIEKKHGLTETREEIATSIRAKRPFKMNFVVKLTRDLMLEKISNKEFLDNLHKELKTSEETTKNLAIDIVNNLIPLLEKIPEDKLGEYNRKKELAERPVEQEEVKEEGKEDMVEAEKKEAFNRAKEELLKKIGARTRAPELQPQENPVAKVPTTSVEENAKQIQQIKRDLNPKTDQATENPVPTGHAPDRSFEKAKEKLAENKFADEKKGPDDYREPIG